MAGTWNEPGEHSVNLTHLQRCVNFFGAALQYHHRSHISYLLGIMFHHLYYVFCKKIVDRVCDAVLVCFSAHLRTELTYDNDIHIFILLYPPLVFARLFVDRFTLCWRWFASQFNIWCSLVYTYMLEQEMEQAKAIPSAASARHTTIFRPGALCITNSSCANHICITFHASSMLHIPFRITIHYTKAMNRRECMAVNKDEIMIWLAFLFIRLTTVANVVASTGPPSATKTGVLQCKMVKSLNVKGDWCGFEVSLPAWFPLLSGFTTYPPPLHLPVHVHVQIFIHFLHTLHFILPFCI